MEKETLAVRWVEHKEESPPERRHNRSHSDPTADAAIGHVLLEERRKKKKKRPRTGVWRAEEEHNESNSEIAGQEAEKAERHEPVSVGKGTGGH